MSYLSNCIYKIFSPTLVEVHLFFVPHVRPSLKPARMSSTDKVDKNDRELESPIVDQDALQMVQTSRTRREDPTSMG